MPHIVTEVPETTANILRPVVMNVVRQLAHVLRLKPETQIIFPGTNQAVAQLGSELGNGETLPNFGYEGFVKLEVREEYMEDRVLSTAVFQQDNRMIFVDRPLSIQIRPVYAGTQVTLDFTYEAPNRVVAERFRDDMMVRTAMLRGENLHELSYYYMIPNAFLIMLKEFHEMREAVAGYGDDFHDWMKEHLTRNATNLATLIGTEMSLAITEKQVCVPGHFDFNSHADPIEKAKDGESYSVKYSYTFTFDKVVSCAFDYPLVIHNQLISDKWYYKPTASGEQVRPDRRLRSPSWTRNAFDYFTPSYRPTVYQRGLDGVSIPEFDDWIPETVHPRTNTVAMIMVQIDLTQPRLVLDLHDLIEYTIDPVILEYMEDIHNKLNLYGQAPIHISLFMGDVALGDADITIDENLVVRTVGDMDPRERYHLRIALVTDLTILPPSALEVFREHGPACRLILITLAHAIVGTAYDPPLIGGQIVSRDSLNAIIQIICDHRFPHQVGIEYRMLTVGSFLIVAHREFPAPLRTSRRRHAGNATLPGRAGNPRPIGPEGPEYPIPSTDS